VSTAPIDIPVKVKGLSDLQKLERRMETLERDLEKVSGKLTKAEKKIKKFGSSAKKASGGLKSLTAGFGKLTSALAALGVTAAAIQGLKFSIASAAELETQTRSLQTLTGSLEDAQNIIQELQDFGAFTPFTSTELIDTAKRLKAFGVDTNKLVETTKRLGDVAGATGAKLDGIATAYGQIVAKGRLQGEELLQLQERGIGLQDELQKMYGLTGEEFRKALEKGRISAEAVELAITRLTTKGGKYANGAIAQSDTLAGKFSTLQDNVTRFAQRIGQVLSPVLKGLLDQVNELISGFNRLFLQGDLEGKLYAAGELDPKSRKALFDESFKEAERLAKLGKFGQGEIGTKALEIYQEALKGVARDVGLIQEKVKSLGSTEIPALLGGTSGSDKATKQLQKQLAEGQKLSTEFTRQLQLLQTRNEFDKQLLQNAYDYEDAVARIRKTADPLQQEGLISQAAAVRNAKDLRTLEDAAANFGKTMGGLAAESVKKVKEELTDVEAALQAIGNQLESTVGSAIDGLIDGTAELNEMLQQTLKDIAKLLIKGALFGFGGTGPAAKGLFGGFFADGGTLGAGKWGIAGESGPEVVHGPARITPMSDLGGGNTSVNITVNADGGVQASSQGSQAEEASRLARMIEASTVSIINREKRPGGILSR